MLALAVFSTWNSRHYVSMTSILVIHGLRHDYRPTVAQNVLSMANYSKVSEVEFVNVFGVIPDKSLAETVILTYDFLALRNLPIWKLLVKRVSHVIKDCRFRVAMPQDDYSCSGILDDFCVEHEVTHMYSPITKDLEVLYPRLSKSRAIFKEALTGYVDEKVFTKLQKYAQPFSERRVDVGQRVRLLLPHLGELAERKGTLALQFGDVAKTVGFVCDISVKPEDVLLGDEWYKFLGNTKFTIGRKGGASLADPRGNLADRVRRYKLRHPTASNTEVRRKVRLDSGCSGDFSAISPRMFESAAMGTCQILEQDLYFPGFEPWRHYIPIDLDHLADQKVFAAMRDTDLAQEIVKNAYEFLVQSGNYSYRTFIQGLLREINIQEGSEQPTVKDSSISLDAATGVDGTALEWLQDYLARAIRSGALKRIRRMVADGTFTPLDEVDHAWKSHALTHRESLLAWIDGIRSGSLIVESVAVPWRSASSYLTSL